MLATLTRRAAAHGPDDTLLGYHSKHVTAAFKS